MDELPGGEGGPARPGDDAPAASPHHAPDPDPAPPPRRRVPTAALGALAAAAIVAWGLAPRRDSVAIAVGDEGQVLEPLQPTADLRTGEQVAPFSGFAVSVETEPAGALVTIAGVPRGEAPVLANLDCAPGDRIEIRAERAGAPAATAQTTCRADALVKLKVRLRR